VSALGRLAAATGTASGGEAAMALAAVLWIWAAGSRTRDHR